MKKLFLIINEDRFFLSHRLPLAKAALNEGFDVTLVTKDTGRKQECIDAGVSYIDFPVNPTGMQVGQELKTLRWLINTFKKYRPDVVHLVGLKCMLWGGVAAKLCRIPVVVNAVSGLGVLFSGERLGLVARGILSVFRWSNYKRKESHLIFQNNDDYHLFLRHKVMTEKQCVFIKGSGVDLKEYDYAVEPEDEKVKVIFTARMVKEKGVCDLIAAAEKLRSKYEDRVEFWLCGGLSSNPRALQKEELEAMCDNRYIKWLGFRTDVLELLRQSHIVAFPSYYREGVPKSLIEASAIGRPIITCNSVGCKDVVDDGVNGFLIDPQNVDALANRLQLLIDDKELRLKMGMKSREKAEREFSIENVVKAHLELYDLVYD